MTSEDDLTTEEHESRQQILVYAEPSGQLNKLTCPRILLLADHEFHRIIGRLPLIRCNYKKRFQITVNVFEQLPTCFLQMIVRKDRKFEIGVESLRPN